MVLPYSLCRRLPYRLVRMLSDSGTSEIGRRRIITPLHDPAALAWLYWQPSWKGRLLGRILSRRPGAVLDVGVNFGQTLADCLAEDITAPYYGFEPNVRCIAYLRELIRINGLNRIHLLPCGLGAETRPSALYYDDTDPMSATATARADLRPGNHLRSEWMMCARLDELVAPLGLDAVGVIKIDVEGGELEALHGMTGLLDTQRPPLLCEVLLADLASDLQAYARRVHDVMRLLRELRYRVRRVVQDSCGNAVDLEPVETFPVARWSPAASNDCDYLFEPVEATPITLD